jgi:hypothetical protein
MVKKLQAESQAAGKRLSGARSGHGAVLHLTTTRSMIDRAAMPWWRRLLHKSRPSDNTLRTMDAAADELDGEEGMSDFTTASSSAGAAANSFGWSIAQVSTGPSGCCSRGSQV